MKTEKSGAAISLPNATVVQKAPEFRELFISFISESYPGIKWLRFRKKRRYYVVRGTFGPRELFSRDKIEETAAARFLNEIKRKVVQTPVLLNGYHSSLDMA